MPLKHVIIPQPPSSQDTRYKDNLMAYMRANEDWCLRIKAILEANNLLSQKPVGPVVIGGFTTNTNFNGTAVLTTTSVANMLCTLSTLLQLKGLITPNSSQG
jgi:hypothetical protein